VNAMLEAALAYARAGTPVFPCREKKPITRKGFHDATTDESQIRNWWTAAPNAQVAAPTGTKSHLLSLDLDTPAAAKFLEELEAKHGSLPPTRHVATSPGRRQIHFSLPDGLPTKSVAGFGGVNGFDIRGDGGYVVLPPSLHHKSGKPYMVLIDEPLADAPQWLIRMLNEPAARARTNGAGQTIPEGQRNSRLTSFAGAMRRAGMDEAAILEQLLIQNQQCSPPLPDIEVERIARSISRYAPAPIPIISPGTSREDTSNAERFAAQHHESVKFWHGRDKWILWKGYWPDAEQREPYELAKLTAKSIFAEAATLPVEEAKRMAHHAEGTLSRKNLLAMLDLAKSDPRIAVTTDQFDRDPMLVNFANGTFDIRTGELREHRPEDYITKIIHCDYVPDATSELWQNFVNQTYGPLADWFQIAVGYSITGDTREKAVFLPWGPTDGGKTTSLQTLKKIFGDYSADLQIETLMWSKSTDNNTSADLADLRGARFVVTSETEKGQSLREAKLKRITQGMGKIKTARKYENPIAFEESHKLWIDCNHEPMIRGTDDSVWNRLYPIPCTHVLKPGEKDKELGDKLLRETEAIAAWAIHGAVRWYEAGLGLPPEIVTAREKWRREMDELGVWIEERTVVKPDESEGADELYIDYKTHAERRGNQFPMAQTAFGLALSERGFEKRRGSGPGRPTMYRGLSLRSR
jgi:putative DNA primase/helicase